MLPNCLTSKKIESLILHVIQHQLPPQYSLNEQRSYLRGWVNCLFMCGRITDCVRISLLKKYVLGNLEEMEGILELENQLEDVDY